MVDDSNKYFSRSITSANANEISSAFLERLDVHGRCTKTLSQEIRPRNVKRQVTLNGAQSERANMVHYYSTHGTLQNIIITSQGYFS